MSVVTPATHDMTTVRQWWQHEREHIQYFYNNILGHYGDAPQDCAPWISKAVIEQHLFSPAMWGVFLLQDLLGIDEIIRLQNSDLERINDPSNPDHDWNYRMHIAFEELLKDENFNSSLKEMIVHSGR